MKDIKFITTKPELTRSAPVIPMKDYQPEWYKKLNVNTSEAKKCPIFNKYKFNMNFPFITVKGCPAVKDYLESGYIIPWPAEVIFETRRQIMQDKIVRTTFTHTMFAGLFGEHSESQFPGLNTNFFKVNSPWLVKTPPGYSTLFFQPYFWLEKRYVLLPAIVDTDLMPIPTNFPGYALEDDFKVEVNEPMICAMPFKRDQFKMKIETRNHFDFTRFSMFLKHVYRNNFWTKKKFD